MRNRIKILTILCAILVSTSIYASGCDVSYILKSLEDPADLIESLEESTDLMDFSNRSKDILTTEESEPELSSVTNYTDNLYIDEDVHYFFKQLSEEDKVTYSALLTGMMKVKSSIILPETDEERIGLIIQAVLADHPELFWCDGSYEYTTYPTHTSMSPTYTYDMPEIASRRKEISSVINAFLASVPAEASEYEQIKQVYEYVITTVSYDDNSTDNQNIYSSMVNKSSVCAGYAREVQYLLHKLNIECLYVVGNIVDADSHAWNIVKCDDKYYQLDATFGDRMESNFQGDDSEDHSDAFLEEMPEEMTVNYGFLCCTDAQLYTDHITEMSLELPICDSNDLNYYFMNGRYYENYSDQIWSDMRESVYAGEKFWECQFANQADYQQAVDEIEKEAYADIVIDYLEDISAYGEFQMWYMNDDSTLTISCWY